MATKLDGQYLDTGRLVMGSLTERDDKDYHGKPVPEDKRNLFFGIAVPKDSPNVMATINALWQMAATDYAGAPLVMDQINQGLAAKDFAWKIQDGDIPTPDKKTGKMREPADYMKGHYIFKFSTLFDFDACDVNGNQISLADMKKGDYVDIMYNSSVNGAVDDTAGIYLNPVAICLVRRGDAIASGVSAVSAFANRQHTLPDGVGHDGPLQANAAAANNAGGGMPGTAGNAATAQTTGASAGGGMPGTAGAAATTSPTEPHNEILNGPGAAASNGGGGMPGM